MLNEILPCTAHLLEDDKSEVRYAATTAFVSIALIIRPEDMTHHILTTVLVSSLIECLLTMYQPYVIETSTRG
jgi:hypothetical protein